MAIASLPRKSSAGPLALQGRGAFGWPGRCDLCGQWGARQICGHCAERFAPLRPRCVQCALSLPGSPADASPHCNACLADAPAFDHAVAVADYGFPWDRLVLRLKFRQRPDTAAALARLMAAAVAWATDASGLPPAELVLPVPLSPRRLAERGYNQAWELARHAARWRGLPARADLLERWRDTAPQVGGQRAQRQANLTDAMGVDPLRRPAIAGRRVALVDDVMTTGATAQAAAVVLRAAGAAQVQVWVLARTPAPADDHIHGAAAAV